MLTGMSARLMASSSTVPIASTWDRSVAKRSMKSGTRTIPTRSFGLMIEISLLSTPEACVPTMEIDFVDLKAQYNAIAPEVDAAIHRVVAGADFILGKDVELFEQEFAAFCGMEHGI